MRRSSELSNNKLLELEVLPNDNEVLKKIGSTVKGIICSHAHLDHLGAISKISNNYTAPIILTPFSYEVLKNLEANQKEKIKNRIIKLNPSKSYSLSNDLRWNSSTNPFNPAVSDCCNTHKRRGYSLHQ
jgi:ribonuclease J